MLKFARIAASAFSLLPLATLTVHLFHLAFVTNVLELASFTTRADTLLPLTTFLVGFFHRRASVGLSRSVGSVRVVREAATFTSATTLEKVAAFRGFGIGVMGENASQAARARTLGELKARTLLVRGQFGSVRVLTLGSLGLCAIVDELTVTSTSTQALGILEALGASLGLHAEAIDVRLLNGSRLDLSATSAEATSAEATSAEATSAEATSASIFLRESSPEGLFSDMSGGGCIVPVV